MGVRVTGMAIYFNHRGKSAYRPVTASEPAQSRTMDRQPLGDEMLLEIGHRITRLLFPVDTLESLCAGDHLLDPHNIRFVVRLDSDFATRRNDLVQGRQEFILNQASRVVMPLWPRVGEADVNHARASGWKQPLYRVETLEP